MMHFQQDSHSRRVRKYFRKHKLGPPPVSPEERLAKALHYLTCTPPNCEAVIILFNTKTDILSTDWLNIIGVAYDFHENNNYFNPEMAVAYLTSAAQLGNKQSLWNLHRRYVLGLDATIDIDAAIYWLQKARRAGHPDAAWAIATIIVDHDQDYDRGHPAVRAAVRSLMDESQRLGSFFAILSIAKFESAGTCGYSRDPLVAMRIYEVVATQSSTQDSNFAVAVEAAYLLSLRYFIGFQTIRDIDSARRYLMIIPKRSNIYCPESFILSAEKLQHLIDRDVLSTQPDACLFMEKIVDTLSKEGIDGIGSVKFYLDSLARTHIQSTVDILWACRELSRHEGWMPIEKNLWSALYDHSHAIEIGVNYGDMIKYTKDTGPRYNKESDKITPVLGSLEPPSMTRPDFSEQRDRTGSFVPMAGVIKFSGLRATQHDVIEFKVVNAAHRPALLLDEDFDVALALAFGNAEGAIEPIFSLEDPVHFGFPKHRKYSFQYKYWHPHWLCFTEFGRTLYACDQIVGLVCWHPREFEIDEGNNPPMFGLVELARRLVSDIELTGGRSGVGSGVRVMLKPEHISIVSRVADRLFSGKTFEVTVNEVKMRIDGDYIIKDDGLNQRVTLHTNDSTYAQGRTVNALTDRYDDLATLMPVFARAKEMMGLLHALINLRMAGFEPAPHFLENIRLTYKKYEERPPLSGRELLCLKLPSTFRR